MTVKQLYDFLGKIEDKDQPVFVCDYDYTNCEDIAEATEIKGTTSSYVHSGLVLVKEG
jgi:hypothetical protein